MGENCALGNNGKLKDTLDIKWFNDADNSTAMNDLSASTSTKSSASTAKLPHNAFSILLNIQVIWQNQMWVQFNIQQK